MSPAVATSHRFWPATPAEWKQVYLARKNTIGINIEKHKFLFALDWNTEPHLIQAAIDSGDAPTLSAGDWALAAGGLEARLRARWFGRKVLPSREIKSGVVGALSSVVAEAVGKLPGKDDAVRRRLACETILEFAAGSLRSRVPFGPAEDPGSMIVSDPDSYYIWYFAEFGTLAIEQHVDEDLWRELMPELITAGLLYRARFKVKRALRAYGLPGEALSAQAQLAVKRSISVSTTPPVDFGPALAQALRGSASSYH